MAEKRTTIMLTDEDRKLIAVVKKDMRKDYGPVSVSFVLRQALRFWCSRRGK